MWKKRILCLVLVLCAALVMTACKQKETFPTTPQQPASQPTDVPADQQNIFGDTPVPDEIDWDDGSYDPTQEAGGDEEEIVIPEAADGPTEAPTMKSEYGSPKPPMFAEAEALHWIDIMDARMNTMKTATDKTPAGAFSERIPSLERRVYHPEMNP